MIFVLVLEAFPRVCGLHVLQAPLEEYVFALYAVLDAAAAVLADAAVVLPHRLHTPHVLPGLLRYFTVTRLHLCNSFVYNFIFFHQSLVLERTRGDVNIDRHNVKT